MSKSVRSKDIAPSVTAKGGRGAKGRQQNKIRSEIIAIFIIASAILLLISLFVADSGFIGMLANSLFRGLFGVGAFILPVLALVYAGILLVGKKDMLRTSKIVMGSGVFLLTISVSQTLAGVAPPDDLGFWEYIGHFFISDTAAGGGLIGYGMSRLFIAAISEVGTYILFFTIIIVLLIMITGRSLFDVLKNTFFAAQRGAVNINERRRIRREELEQEYQEHEQDIIENRRYITAPNDYEYAEPKRGPKVLDMEERGGGYDGGTRDDSIILIKDELSSRRGGPTLAPAPRLPKDIVLSDDALEVEEADFEETETYTPQITPMPISEPYIKPAIEPIIEEPEFSISVKGIVEGYTPAAIQADEMEKEEAAPPPVSVPYSAPVISAAPKEEMPPFEIDLPMPRRSEEEIIVNTEMQEYIYPPVELLRENTYTPSLSSRAQILENSKKLEETLQSFGVAARVVEVCKGPTVTRYELSPGSGVKVSKISGLADDLALNLAAAGIRIEAPIPNKSVVGIEIPNKDVQAVFLREVIDDEAFWNAPSKLSFAMGKDIAGNTVIADIAKMPHLLIAGATGAGKSVCINTLITSIIYKASPQDVKLLMIDPKVVELSVYNGIPHLLIPVVTDPKKASGALAWGVREMDSRYNLFAESRVRDLAGYNNYLAENELDKLPQIVIIIDELADLMMTCGKEVEESICRLAQKARAAGIHLIIATQRPSVDVITGLIKANVPSRLAFAVSSGTDSRTILDMTGAEKLLGKGDMLFSPVGLSKPQRIQGSLITDKEVENIVNFIKQDGVTEYSEEMIEKITTTPEASEFSSESDPLIDEAIAFIVEREKASTSMLQRRFRIGYNRAARMMEELVARGLVGPEDGAKPRKVLMTQYQHREWLENRKAE